MGNCPSGELSWWGIVLVGNCPSGELSWWGLVLVGSCQGGNCPVGNCPVGSCPDTVIFISHAMPIWYTVINRDKRWSSHMPYIAENNGAAEPWQSFIGSIVILTMHFQIRPCRSVVFHSPSQQGGKK